MFGNPETEYGLRLAQSFTVSLSDNYVIGSVIQFRYRYSGSCRADGPDQDVIPVDIVNDEVRIGRVE